MQAPDDYEIVIVDGASTDDTPQIMKSYLLQSPQIRYCQMAINRGIDPDIAEAVAMSKGEYVWLMSSDDVIPDGAVAKVVDALSRGRDLYLGGRAICTEDLRLFGTEEVILGGASAAWDFSNERDLLSFFRNSTGLMSIFSYISILIFRRETWDASPDPSRGIGSCYAHAFRLWTVLSSGGIVETIAAPIVMCRMGTDNFASRGVFKRFLLDFDGYLAIASDVFGDRPNVSEAFLGVLRREHRVFRLAKFYRAASNKTQREVAQARLRSTGHSAIRIRLVECLALLGPILDAAVVIRRTTRRGLGRFRNKR